MAFGFIKKVFSFGKKEVVEEKIDETAPLPPLNFDALKPAPADEAAPDTMLPSEGRMVAERLEEAGDAAKGLETPGLAETTPSGPSDLPLEGGEIPAPVELSQAEPEPEPAPPLQEHVTQAPEPVPSEIPAKPEPQEPEAPAPVPAEPAPQEIPAEPASEPETPQPVEPAPDRPSKPVEVPPPSQPKPQPQPIEIAPGPSVEVPSAPPQEDPAQQPAEVPAEPVPPEAPAPSPSAHSRDEGERQHRPPQNGSVQPADLAPVQPSVPMEAPTRDAAALPPSDHLPVSEDRETAAKPPPASPANGKDAVKVTVAKKVEQKAEPVAAPELVAKKSWFQRMREGLSRSSRELTGNIAGVFTKRKLDEDTLQDLEDILIRADLGVETALRVTDSLASSRYGKTIADDEVRAVLAEEIGKVLTPVAQPLELDLSHKPHVILVVGVNGTGKTTTIGKLAAKLTEGGLSVMLAAGDTFRAAAIEQLNIWGERTRSPVVASKLGADAAGLAYDAFEKAKEAGTDVLIIDTAGRLQNKAELMAELEKIVRVLGKLDPEAPHTVLQTVDATTGQNALNQVEIFRNVAGVNGLVMTKLDGTARGGILVAIAAKHRLPVYFIGVGEQVDDLEPFSASDFARAIAGVA
ncbi:signal recognition particle-docking protein FtsY [Mesorhizobium sp. CN5-321]|jgi:fused signal recognition particle receptor|uniref:signal recognition particle-docking protein FtsY n=1 Tax=Mesorhizobium hunchu TaxID=3157708 RepID=UPI0032B772FA